MAFRVRNVCRFKRGENGTGERRNRDRIMLIEFILSNALALVNKENVLAGFFDVDLMVFSGFIGTKNK